MSAAMLIQGAQSLGDRDFSRGGYGLYLKAESFKFIAFALDQLSPTT